MKTPTTLKHLKNGSFEMWVEEWVATNWAIDANFISNAYPVWNIN